MHTFTDAKGRQWPIEINVAAVKLVRDLTGVNLYTLFGGDFADYSKLMADPVQLVDVLYVLCQRPAEAAGVTDEDFGRGMAGDALKAAADAFTQELISFFPKAQRETLGKLMTVIQSVAANLENEQGKLASDLAQSPGILELTNKSSGNSPAPSESTPAP
jgi:hypothetical protein